MLLHCGITNASRTHLDLIIDQNMVIYFYTKAIYQNDYFDIKCQHKTAFLLFPYFTYYLLLFDFRDIHWLKRGVFV